MPMVFPYGSRAGAGGVAAAAISHTQKTDFYDFSHGIFPWDFRELKIGIDRTIFDFAKLTNERK